MNEVIPSRAVAFAEIQPLGPLGDFVECYWTMASAQPLQIPVRNRILPDGCLDFIFVTGGSLHVAQSEGASHTLPRAFLVGPMNTSSVALLGGTVRIWGIRFKPGGARAFLPLPLEAVADQHVPLVEVWEAACGLADLLADDLNHVSQVARLESFLLHHQTGRDPPPAWLPETVRQICQADHPISISHLARAAKVSSRQMERQFRNHVGLSPKHSQPQAAIH